MVIDLLVATACSSVSSTESSFSIDVQGQTSEVESFRAVLAQGDRVLAVDCPDEHSEAQLRCIPGGLEMPSAARKGELTIKARGYYFNTTSPKETEVIQLRRLSAPQRTEDYRTGFSVEDFDAFKSLAVVAKTELGLSYSVKFYIRGLKDKPEVYFQNTRKHTLHYDFAHQVLGVALSRSDFENATYHGENREAMAGTLVVYPELTTAPRQDGKALVEPIVLNFFPSDDLSPKLALLAHQLIEERLGFASLSGKKSRLVYVPAGEANEEALRAEAGIFLAREASVATLEELYGGLKVQILNPGLAYGTLRRLSPEDLTETVVSRSDILLLTRLPNELPIVGGTLTEELQTPLAHVNLAARTRGTPNVALPSANQDPRVRPFINQLVRYEVTDEGFTIKAATLDEAQAFWVSRQPTPFIPEQDLSLEGFPSFSELGFSDASRVGAKAANLAELHHLLGDLAPDGLAVPFSASDAYLRRNTVTNASCSKAFESCNQEGRARSVCDAALAICQEGAFAGDNLHNYAFRLLAHPKVLSDTVLREAVFAGLVFLIENGHLDNQWAADFDARIVEQFGETKVRLRSSTNSEDLPGFSGAGLYRSVSAQASEGNNPSSRIRKVWASLWSFRAVEERTYWGIDHAAVQMGVAVDLAHDDEVANGVLITKNISDPNVYGMYVNVQRGEVEVTNPEGGAIPEVFSIIPSPKGGVQVARQRYSSLSMNSALVSDAEVYRLFEAADKTQKHFAKLYRVNEELLTLDIEFKVLGTKRTLLFKQVRPYSNSLAQ
jgi:hypothetical protein